jgi:predicted transcriptional regulator
MTTTLVQGKAVDFLTNAGVKPRCILAVAGVALGLKNRQIAELVGTTEQVIKNYLWSVFRAVKVRDRINLVVYLAKHGLLGELRQMARDAKGDVA